MTAPTAPLESSLALPVAESVPLASLPSDVPCGAGRLQHFVTERGGRWYGADRSRAMLATARDAAGGAGTPLVHADAGALPFDGSAFDAVVCFRFLHHLPPERAAAVVAELCRVARCDVVVSHFHPISLHHLRRTLSGLLRGRPASRHAVLPATLDAWFSRHGFEPVGRRAQAAWLRDLWVAHYRRRG